jgi:hypothetical protein
MINAHFDNVYENVSFCAYYEAVKDDEGKTIYIEYDPTSSPDCTSSFIQMTSPRISRRFPSLLSVLILPFSTKQFGTSTK